MNMTSAETQVAPNTVGADSKRKTNAFSRKKVRTVLDRRVFQALKNHSRAELVMLLNIYMRAANDLLRIRMERQNAQQEFLYFAPSGEHAYLMITLTKQVAEEVQKAAKADNVSVSLFMFNALLIYYRKNYKPAQAKECLR